MFRQLVLNPKLNSIGQNVSYLAENELCVGCGACYAICPSDAIELRLENVFIPKIMEEKCENCSLCLDVCPVLNWKKSQEISCAPQELLGEYVANYIGYAVEERTRYMGSSGGIITAILCFAIDEGLIDGAIVSKPTSGLLSGVFMAKNKEEINAAQGSKYFPVPMVSAIKDVIITPGRFAFVGLPCHLIALKKMEQYHPCLKDKIVLKLGLFCGRGVDSNGIKYVLRTYKVPIQNVTSISFRGYGWPGKMHISYFSGGKKSDVFIPHHEYVKYLFPAYYFMPKSCLFCSDHIAEHADLSFGDPW